MTDYTDHPTFTYIPGAGSKLWHDSDRTIPAEPGMTVAAIEEYRCGKRVAVFVQPVMSRRPICVLDPKSGLLGARFAQGGDNSMMNVEWLRQNPNEGMPPQPHVAYSTRPLTTNFIMPSIFSTDGSQTILDQSGNGRHWHIPAKE